MKVVIHYKNGQLLFSSSNDKETIKAVKVVSKWCKKRRKEFITGYRDLHLKDEFYVIVEKGLFKWKITTDMKKTGDLELLKKAIDDFLSIFN